MAPRRVPSLPPIVTASVRVEMIARGWFSCHPTPSFILIQIFIENSLLKNTVSLCLLPRAHLLPYCSTPVLPTRHITYSCTSVPWHWEGLHPTALPFLIDRSKPSSWLSSNAQRSSHLSHLLCLSPLSCLLVPLHAYSESGPLFPVMCIAFGTSLTTPSYNSLCSAQLKDGHRFFGMPPMERWGLSPLPFTVRLLRPL